MNPYEPILKEIATGLLETVEVKQDFLNDAFIDATLIFLTVLIDKVFDNQNYDEMPFEQLRKLIHTYTNIDTVKLIEDYGK